MKSDAEDKHASVIPDSVGPVFWTTNWRLEDMAFYLEVFSSDLKTATADPRNLCWKVHGGMDILNLWYDILISPSHIKEKKGKQTSKQKIPNNLGWKCL